MASKKELQVAQKRELEKREETTIPARIFLPNADEGTIARFSLSVRPRSFAT
jgi:hypothetical protein